ncbi:cytochrome P450 306a1 [Bradysia coprophila]|uniref:cytochrome P450 306a1 n=1 Tax=Bradysia coprophila TaxID=38358 RepID=UPI00187DA819|nr:cytochrome P450 306a1 [Bradysia coprophila]
MLALMFVLIVGLLTLFYYWKKRKNYPPGPWISLPIIGNLHLLDPLKPYITLTQLSKKYGPIYGIQMGSVYTVVVSNDAIIRDCFKSDQFMGRAPLYVTHGIMGGFGLICAEGELWKDQRKLSIKMLKEMGMVKFGEKRSDFEFRILKWVQECVKTLIIKSELNDEIDPVDTLQNTLGNVLNDFVFGVTYDQDDDTWTYLRHLQEEGVKHIGVSGVVNFIPWLRFLPSNQKILEFLLIGKQKTHQIYDDIIKRCENQTLDDSNDKVSSIASLYLEEKERRIQDGEDSVKHCSDAQLKHLLADLFGAGVDTTLTTIRWFLLFVADNENVQNKLRLEFEENLTSMPTLDNYDKLPYLRACIAETQRIRSVVPVGIPHGSSMDTTLQGYYIPKNTMIIPLQWAVHMNPDVWPEPYKYDPDRFLDSEGKFCAPSAFIPFQTGKRMCLGEEMAKMLLFLFCGNISYNFKLQYKGLEPVESILGECGITLNPPREKIKFQKIA